MCNLNNLLQNNKRWAKNIKQENSQLLKRLSKGQNPKYLWIGCSDSRVPANVITGLPPGEIFEHRNIANIVSENDINCLSVIQFAVETLNVEHIIVCGHYDCGGIKAAISGKSFGFMDKWIENLKQSNWFMENLTAIKQSNSQNLLKKLIEFNVEEQVKNVCNTQFVKNARKQGKPISIHGLVFDIETGKLAKPTEHTFSNNR
jgi:carbonic anhydrase